MSEPFHLSIGVKDIEASCNFFEEILRCTVVHRDPTGYVNIDFFGNQITLKPIPAIRPDLEELHFGVNLSKEEFADLSNHILKSQYQGVVSGPKVVDPDTTMERHKMFLRCPTGYLFEIKGY